MAEDRQGGDPRGTLPDFSSQEPAGLPDYSAPETPVGEPSPRSRRRALVVMLSVIGSTLVLIAVGALVLSQTVFRSALEADDPAETTAGERTATGQEEYIPDEDDPDLAPPPPIFTQAPTTACTIPDSAPAASADPGTVRGGDLQYTIPSTWTSPWDSTSMPYMDEIGAQARNVEGNWYSAVSLGRVVFPEDEGGYPGLEPAAVAIFQCYATTAGVIGAFGENPEVTDYRSEAITVDGAPAWIVQATYHFEDSEMYSTTSASVVTSIVVETPDGASALASDVAADHEDHVAELQEMIDSLEVVG